MRRTLILISITLASLSPVSLGQGRPTFVSLVCIHVRTDRSHEFVVPESQAMELKERLEQNGFACQLPKALPTTK